MDIGKKINELIETHVELWHNTSPARTDKSLNSEERVALFMKTRELNHERSKIRDEINEHFGSGYPDPKLNYTNCGG